MAQSSFASQELNPIDLSAFQREEDFDEWTHEHFQDANINNFLYNQNGDEILINAGGGLTQAQQHVNDARIQHQFHTSGDLSVYAQQHNDPSRIPKSNSQVRLIHSQQNQQSLLVREDNNPYYPFPNKTVSTKLSLSIA